MPFQQKEFLAAGRMTQEAFVHEACCELISDVARVSGQVQLKVAGASMLPLLWPGDLVFVTRCDPSQLIPNSLVMFRRNKRLVVHRVMQREASFLVTRGDANPGFDAPVDYCDVVGCVETVLRNGHPVNLKGTVWQKALAYLFRRSAWCTRFVHRIALRLRGSETVKAF